MRVAALYDVHGNLPALQAVLADAERSGVDRIVCGGDLVAGPMPRSDSEIVTRLTPDDQLAAALDSPIVRLVVGGHTHVQVDRRLPNGTRFVKGQRGT